MSDTIAVRGIRAFGRHGANAGEKNVPQPFDIDVELDVDLDAARRTDRLAETIDYAALHAAIVAIVATSSHDLLERIGQDVLDRIFSDPRVVRAAVSIGKPRLLAGATPIVTVRQTR
jgi:dihydroneopterin aldolase